MRASPYRDHAFPVPMVAPPLGWTRWASALLLLVAALPVTVTFLELVTLKDCDGTPVPRWDEAGALLLASLGIVVAVIPLQRSARRRLAEIRTRDAISGAAWSVLGVAPALMALAACSLLALHFSFEHLFDRLCLDLAPIFAHGC